MAEYAALRFTRAGRGRAIALALTPAGHKRLASSHDAVLEVEDTMVQGLSASARHHLVDLLTRCAENLEGA
jgi:DNA-binding MarR family transcriptional regulator